FDRRVDRFFSNVKIYAADYSDYWNALQRDGRVEVEDAAIHPATRKLHAERMPKLARLAMLDVGIRSEREIVGLFSFHRVDAAGGFSPEERLLSQSMADLVALSWERADKLRAEQAVSERNERLARHSRGLGRIAALLTPNKAFEEVVEGVVTAVAQTLNAWSVTYWSLSDVEQLVAAFNADGADAAARLAVAPTRYPAIKARVAQQSCEVGGDMAADADYVEYYRDHLHEYGRVSALQGVVTSQQKPVGLLRVLDLERAHPWYPEDPIFVSGVNNLLSLHWETLARRVAEIALSN